MKISIRRKLVLAISVLVIVLFTLVAVLFVQEKRVELSDDIFRNAVTFVRLSAPDIVADYELYLGENSFVVFNREIQSYFDQNDDVHSIKVVNYAGEILYDSEKDLSKKYSGDIRYVDEDLLRQIRSENIAVKAFDGEVYLDGEDFVDYYGGSIDPLKAGTKIDYIVVPATEQYSIVYYVNYHNLEERIFLLVERIGLLAVFGILLGILLAFVMSTHVTRPIKKLVFGAEEIAKGDFDTRVDIRTKDEIGYLGEAFNKMAVDLKDSVEARVYKERVGRELEIATQIQKQIIPEEKDIPSIEGLDVAAGIWPAEEMGGDMYDFMKIDDSRLLMYLGDVTGHGVPAGIVGSIASALFYGYSNEPDLKKLMVKVNSVMKEKTMTNMFMTLCLMEWNNVEKEFKYVSAGHEQLIHYKAKERKCELTPAGGIALGMIPDVSQHLRIEEVLLEEGDFIVVYSDGIPEAWKDENHAYGMGRFIEKVSGMGGLMSAAEIRDAILADVRNFTAGYKQMDDITLIVMKRR